MGRASRETWQKRVERWGASGLTAGEFASEIGVNARTLTYWKWKLASRLGADGRPGRRGQREISPTFVEVMAAAASAVSSDGAASEALEVVLEGGIRVRVPARFDAEALRRVVAALGAR